MAASCMCMNASNRSDRADETDGATTNLKSKIQNEQ